MRHVLKFLCIWLFGSNVNAQLGETRSQLEARYGQPFLVSGINGLAFEDSGYVLVFSINGEGIAKSMKIWHPKKSVKNQKSPEVPKESLLSSNFTEKEVKLILEKYKPAYGSGDWKEDTTYTKLANPRARAYNWMPDLARSALWDVKENNIEVFILTDSEKDHLRDLLQKRESFLKNK
ncbi:MAG: hypothetical protein EBR01_14645 [Proteobacteria bacterium]|nr:hypothetical protein [Pseudomonadota bacterium]